VTTRISNRQYALIKEFAAVGQMSIQDAQKFDQRALRSMLIREWVAYAPSRGFFLTKAGHGAYDDFRYTAIVRANPFGPLTRYFDPHIYGLMRKGPHLVAKAPKRKSA
jgi:hypothetical protein